MVIDTLENAGRYESLHPHFKAAFDFLKRPDLATLAAGKRPLTNEPDFAIIQTYETKPIDEGKLEAHRKFIDIQLIVSGEEFMGYAPLTNQKESTAYKAENDIAFFDGEAWFTLLRKGMFAIFFPGDAHLPGRFTQKPSTVKKIVLKIAVST